MGIAVGAFRKIPTTAPDLIDSICPLIQAMREFIDGQKTRLKLGISKLSMQIAVKSAAQRDADIVGPHPRPFSRWEKGANPLDLRG